MFCNLNNLEKVKSNLEKMEFHYVVPYSKSVECATNLTFIAQSTSDDFEGDNTWWFVYYQSYDSTQSFTNDFIPEGALCHLPLHQTDMFVFEKHTFHNHNCF